MDRKTLEIMAERVDKARHIIQRIEELNEFIYELENRGIFSINFYDSKGNIWAETKYMPLVLNIRDITIESARKEINRLEDELTEL